VEIGQARTREKIVGGGALKSIKFSQSSGIMKHPEKSASHPLMRVVDGKQDPSFNKNGRN